MIAAFSLAGAQKIIAIDIALERLELAKEFGATDLIDIKRSDELQRINEVKKLTDDLGAGILIEACGVPETISEGINMLRRGGKLFELGHAFYAGLAKIDPYTICRNEIEILGIYVYPSSNSFLHAVKLLNENKLPYEKLTKIFSLDNYREIIFEKKTEGTIKPVFRL